MGSKSKYLICRLCLSYGELLIDVCGPQGESGFEVKEAIEDLLQVEVTATGDLPWLLCLGCIAKLEDFSNFKFKCISSNSAFVQRFSKPPTGVVCPSRTKLVSVTAGQKNVFIEESRGRVVEVRVSERAALGGISGKASGAVTHRLCSRSTVERIPGTHEGREVASPSETTPEVISIKEEEEEEDDETYPVVPCPLRCEVVSGGVAVTTVSNGSRDSREAYHEKETDSSDVVQSEVAESDEEDGKLGVFPIHAFDHKTGGRRGNSVPGYESLPSGEATAPCPGQDGRKVLHEPSERLPMLMSDGDQESRDAVLLKKWTCEMRSEPMGPLAIVTKETPLERKRRLARERQRRFRQRQSSEMAWRRARDQMLVSAGSPTKRCAYGVVVSEHGDEGGTEDCAEGDETTGPHAE